MVLFDVVDRNLQHLCHVLLIVILIAYHNSIQDHHYLLCSAIIRNSTMSLTTLVLCFFISQICFCDHKYVFHLGKVFFHLVEFILNLVASMFLTLCPNLSNFRTSSHVPWEMSHMAILVYYKIWNFCIFFVLYRIFFKFIMFCSKCPKCHTRFFLFV